MAPAKPNTVLAPYAAKHDSYIFEVIDAKGGAFDMAFVQGVRHVLTTLELGSVQKHCKRVEEAAENAATNYEVLRAEAEAQRQAEEDESRRVKEEAEQRVESEARARAVEAEDQKRRNAEVQAEAAARKEAEATASTAAAAAAAAAAGAVTVPAAKKSGSDVDPIALEQLISMGFGKKACTKALKATHGNFNEAMDWILAYTSEESGSDEDSPALTNMPPPAGTLGEEEESTRLEAQRKANAEEIRQVTEAELKRQMEEERKREADAEAMRQAEVQRHAEEKSRKELQAAAAVAAAVAEYTEEEPRSPVENPRASASGGKGGKGGKGSKGNPPARGGAVKESPEAHAARMASIQKASSKASTVPAAVPLSGDLAGAALAELTAMGSPEGVLAMLKSRKAPSRASAAKKSVMAEVRPGTAPSTMDFASELQAKMKSRQARKDSGASPPVVEAKKKPPPAPTFQSELAAKMAARKKTFSEEDEEDW